MSDGRDGEVGCFALALMALVAIFAAAVATADASGPGRRASWLGYDDCVVPCSVSR